MPAPPYPRTTAESLAAGWRRLGADPVRLLLAAMVALGADLALGIGAAHLLLRGDGPPLAPTLLVLLAARTLAVSGARGALLALLVEDEPGVVPTPRPLRIAVLDALTFLLALVAGGLAALPWLALAGLGTLQGATVAVPVLLVPAALCAWGAGLVVRAATVTWLLRVARGHGRGRSAPLAQRIGVLATADLARVLGSLLVVPALPTYPWPLAALVARTAPAPDAA